MSFLNITFTSLYRKGGGGTRRHIFFFRPEKKSCGKIYIVE